MSTVPAAILTMVVLSVGGLLPATALVGPRLVVVPLLPLAGAVIAALAATSYVAVGGNFTAWFAGLAVAAGVAVIVIWWRRGDRRPWRGPDRRDAVVGVGPRLIGVIGALAIVGACVWCLRGLATPTVGFDARALWLMRAGWFLQSHHQLLVKMRVPDVVLTQSAYPPLVSASTAVAWRIAGDQSVRLGVVVIALLNTCALITGAGALVEAGRRLSIRLSAGSVPRPETAAEMGSSHGAGLPARVPLAPMLVATVAATLLVFIAFGITEPFMTNGYADPIWSLAAVGAVAFGLQLERSRANQGVALILLLVAGMSKDEGVVTAALLIGLIAFRGLATMSTERRRRCWWRPLLLGLVELLSLALWPVLMEIVHARGDSSSISPAHDFLARARASYDGMVPYLHVIVLAAALAMAGSLALSRVRREGGLANEGWAWVALTCGLLAVGGAFVAGTGAIKPWLETTVHRVTEFSALTGWWIVAVWAVVASAVPASRRRLHQVVGVSDAVHAESGEFGRAAVPAAVTAE
jgi:hypothetical protein